MNNDMKRILLTGLASAFILWSGCSNDPVAVSGSDPAIVSLSTRSETVVAESSHRLLAFGNAGVTDDCLLNYSFVSGGAVKLAGSTYRFVVLTTPGCLDLPAAGTTAGIAFDGVLPLKEGMPVEQILVSQPEAVTVPATTSYTASLKPATCLLKLTLADIPEGLSVGLTNMAAGLSPSGDYTSAGNITYPLKEGDNLCLPTTGGSNGQLSFALTNDPSSTSGTLDLGTKLEAGYTYRISLQWHGEAIGLTSEVTQWLGTNNTDGSAD